MEKPFVFGVPASGEHFTDRKKETRQLATNFTYGVNTILISPRRWGKTSLVDKAVTMIDGTKVKVVRIDIFSCRTQYDFYNRYASAIIRQTSTKFEEWVNNAKRFLSRISPRFSFGTDPMNDFSLSFDLTNPVSYAEDILQLPEKIAKEKGIRIVVCIDEFQQIGEFADTLTFQKHLRSVWQHHVSTSYCLYGSKRHMMHEIFDQSSKPFYKFGEIINLPKIPVPDWVEYIKHQFIGTGKDISDELAGKICTLVDSNSSYVQQLSWILWTSTRAVVSGSDLDEAFTTLLEQNGPFYEKMIEDLSGYQISYLRAMTDGVSSGFSSQSVIDRYRLGTSANVRAIQRALQKKEIIYIERGKSVFCDPLLPHWLKQNNF